METKETREEGVAGANPFDTLWNMATGYCLSRCLHTVADLGVADALDDSPQTAAELAQSVGANPDALGRIMRLLASHGVFEMRDDMFGHSPASRMLRGDHPRSMRDHARMWGLSVFWASFEEMEHSARTGLPAMPEVSPRDCGRASPSVPRRLAFSTGRWSRRRGARSPASSPHTTSRTSV